jgi:hypothetical protein
LDGGVEQAREVYDGCGVSLGLPSARYRPLSCQPAVERRQSDTIGRVYQYTGKKPRR